MWPFKRNKWKPPNRPLTPNAFGSTGAWELWQGLMDVRERVGRIEGGLMLLIPLVLAILGLLIAEGLG
jgi:hypothetical protein